jgi:hypothetical protein
LADVIIGWQDVMNKHCQVNTEMKKAADGQTMSVSVDVLHNGWVPLVALLNVL